MKKTMKITGKGLKPFVSTFLTAAFLFSAALPTVQAATAEDGFVLNGSVSSVYQLEDGNLSGDAVSASEGIPGYTGSGYVSGFLSSEDSVSFDVNVTKSGIYGLSLRSALYMENQALGRKSGQSSSHTQTSGDVTDGNPERGSYWGSGQPVTPDEPKWLQLDLGSVIPVHMIRIRIVTDWGARSETFAVLGSTDGETFTTLKETDEYYFEPAGKGNLAGNYVDAVFDPAEIRFVRILFTGVSDNGSNGAQVGELEVYSPLRSAQLYLDGDLVSEFDLDVDPANIVAADWDARVLSWAEKEIGELTLIEGAHNIEIKSGSKLPGELNLDSITFHFKQALADEATVNVINLISALNPVYNVTLSDSKQILAAKAAYDELTVSQKASIPAALVEKLNTDVRRLSLIGGTAAIDNLVCNDESHAENWSVKTNLQIGDISHGDRTFTFNDVPAELWGCDWISPAMDSKLWNAESELLTFDVLASTNLYVAWDNSAPTPEWLEGNSGFTKTNLTLSINNTDKTIFELYQKEVTAGETVSLGNMGLNKAVYLVLLEHFTMDVETDSPIPDEPGITPDTPDDPKTGSASVAIAAVAVVALAGAVVASKKREQE